MELKLFVLSNSNNTASAYDSSYMKLIHPSDCHNKLDQLNNIAFTNMYMMYDVYQNLRQHVDYNTKYIGFNQKRRYFDINYTTALNYVQNGYSILPAIERFNESIINQYNKCCDNTNEDFTLIRYIINELYPEYVSIFDTYMNTNNMHPHNMFITDIETFKIYMKFAFDIMERFCEYHNFNSYKDIYKYVLEHKERFPLLDLSKLNNNYSTIDYSSRICGFILERLTSMWFVHNTKFKEVPLIIYDNL